MLLASISGSLTGSHGFCSTQLPTTLKPTPSLAIEAKTTTMRRMKLTAVIALHLLVLVAFVWGILLLMQGKPALLLGATAVYILGLGKIGCAAH